MVDRTARERKLLDDIEESLGELRLMGSANNREAAKLDEDLRHMKADVGMRGGALKKAVEQARSMVQVANYETQAMCDKLRVGDMLDELGALATHLIELSQ